MAWRTIVWVAAGALSGWAASMAVHHSTPVDAALPLLAIVMTGVAALTRPAFQVAVPLLIAAEWLFPDEHTRLIAFGLILGVTLAAAMLAERSDRLPAAAITAGAIVILRWIPLSEVQWFREVVLIALAVAIVAAFRWTRLGILIAVLTALITPAIPLRTLVIPVVLLIVAGVLWLVRFPKIELAVPSAFAIAVTMTFFAWSGAFARALPLLLRAQTEAPPRETLNMALRAHESVTVEIPQSGRALLVSGANVARLRKGTVVGRVEPGGRVLRIGDVADWGAFRREQSWRSRNPLPKTAAGVLRGYGQNAWFDGAARIALQPGTYRITADGKLAAEARLQLDAIEMERR